MMPVKYSPVQNFQKHMEDKIEKWNPFSLHLGEDFAVFEFNYEYQRNNAHANLVHYQNYYGYESTKDDTDRLVIINVGEGCINYD